MSSFEAHGIRHLSASSLNMWQASPGMWTMRYLGKFKDSDGPSMWRGLAVEAGIENILRGKSVEDATAAAISTFDANAMGETSEEIDSERNDLVSFIHVAADRLGGLPPLIASQLKIETWLDGVDIPVIGYLDYLLESGAVLDCKATRRMPSKPYPGHVRQMAIYAKARDTRDVALLYSTPKRMEIMPLSSDDVDAALVQVTRAAHSLERFLSRFGSARQAIGALPLDEDSFYWSPEATAARELIISERF